METKELCDHPETQEALTLWTDICKEWQMWKKPPIMSLWNYYQVNLI